MDEILELVFSAKNGDNHAFEALLDKYQGLLSSMSKKYSDMCYEVLKDREDFLQEAKIAFYNAVMSFDEGKGRTFGAYAKVCIRNKLVSCIRELNSKKRLKKTDSLIEITTPANIQDKAIQRMHKKELYKLAKTHLSSYEYLIFEMYSSGQKGKEISAKIGRTEKSVNNAICRIKAKLNGL